MTQSQKDTSAAQSAFAMGETAMQQLEEAGLGPLRWMGTAWVEQLADVNSEIISFFADRIKEDVKTQHELLHCKSAQDLQKAQLAYFQKAKEQYEAETGRLMNMGMQMQPAGSKATKTTPV